MTTELDKLKSAWKQLTSEEMPLAFSMLPLPQIRRAIDLMLAGNHVFVPSVAPVAACDVAEDSLMEWDGHNLI